MNTKSVLQLPTQPRPNSDSFRVSLLGTFEVRHRDCTLPGLPAGSQRLLGFLALRERSITRTLAAGTLWPDASDGHAHASLRSAILRLSRLMQESIQVSFHDLRLADDIVVDIHEARALANRLLADETAHLPGDFAASSIEALSSDLLPDWYDEWAMVEAERWRQLRLHALEALAMHLASRCQYGLATGAAMAAIQGDPLRETAHTTLVRIHLAEGNQSDALEAVNKYRSLLRAELGLEPTPEFFENVRHIQRRMSA